LDPAQLVAVDYDDRDLSAEVPPGATYVDPDAPIGDKKYWDQLGKDLVDHLVRAQTMDVRTNKDLKLFSRPGETEDSFKNRCTEAADAQADAETAKLKDKYESRHQTLAAAVEAAGNQVDIAKSTKHAREGNVLLSAAGSLLKMFLGGRTSTKSMANTVLRTATTVGGRTGQAATAGKRVDAAEDKVGAKQAELDALDAEFKQDVDAIHSRWSQIASTIATVQVPLEKTDVKVSQVVLAWIGKGA
jgi:vacuolar-type H+-ATPase subunit I/STV1